MNTPEAVWYGSRGPQQLRPTGRRRTGSPVRLMLPYGVSKHSPPSRVLRQIGNGVPTNDTGD